MRALPRSLRARLAGALVGVLLIGLVSMALIAQQLLRRSLRRETRAHLAEIVQVLILHWRFEMGEGKDLAVAARESSDEIALRSTQHSLLGPDGALLAGQAPPPEARDAVLRTTPRSGSTGTVALPDGGIASYAPLVVTEGGGVQGWAIAASPGGRPNTTLGSQRNVMERAIAGGLVLGSIGAVLLVWHALAPIGVMARRARELVTAPGSGLLPVGAREDELDELAEAFNELLGRMRGALEGQRQMVADASHDIRTPLAAVRAEVDVALAEADRSGPEYRASLESIGVSVARLERIVADLFLLARSDEGGIELRPEYVYLSDVAGTAARALRPLAAARGQEIHVEARDEGFVRGEMALLERLVGNLLENAVKFGAPNGTIELRVAERGDVVELSVTDDGPGIPPEHIAHVFSRFYRADPARSVHESSGGSGLGLAIVERIAALHGGSVSAANVPSGGACLRVTLPRASEETVKTEWARP